MAAADKNGNYNIVINLQDPFDYLSDQYDDDDSEMNDSVFDDASISSDQEESSDDDDARSDGDSDDDDDSEESYDTDRSGSSFNDDDEQIQRCATFSTQLYRTYKDASYGSGQEYVSRQHLRETVLMKLSNPEFTKLPNVNSVVYEGLIFQEIEKFKEML